MPRKIIQFISLILCFVLVFQQSGFTQVAGQLDISGHLAALHQSLTAEKFRPLHLRYLSYDQLKQTFNLLLDKGDFMKGLSPLGLSLKNITQGTVPEEKLKSATQELLNYFFTGVSLPNDTFWVNLRPDSPQDIIDPRLENTEIGRIFLEADLELKKDTALATSPETPQGKKYWDKLYQKAEELFGSENITIPTLTRPWIVPDEIIIREGKDNAYIYKSTLKVMLEEDYLAKGLSPQGTVPEANLYTFTDPRLKTLNQYATQLVKELIIPKLTKEINTSKKYAPLRQVYYSLILAQWFKERFRDSPLRTAGIRSGGDSPFLRRGQSLSWSKTTYFQAYQKSFKDGEYNVQEQRYSAYGQTIRTYFSGGIALGAKEILSCLRAGTIQAVNSQALPVPNAHTIGVKVEPTGEVTINLPETLTSTDIENIIRRSDPNAFLPHIRLVSERAANRNIIDPEAIIKLYQEVRNQGGFLRIFKKGPRSPQPTAGAIDLEHFVYAQMRLKDRQLTTQQLKELLEVLNIKYIDIQKNPEEAYRKIYEKLAAGNYNQEVIDLINAGTYEDPRLEIAVSHQNQNPRAQSIYEAVSNGLDALGFNIGQFGKGVKQILSWLEPNGKDRIDVFSRQAGHPAYCLSLIKGTDNQISVQIQEVSLKAFKDAVGQDIAYGTMVRVTTQSIIPRTDSQRDEYRRNSQQGIADGIHRRFPFVTQVEITTQTSLDRAPRKVNGFGSKEVIVPAQQEAAMPEDTQGRFVKAILNDHSIAVIDNGTGMDAEVLSCMFVPKHGTKEPLSPDKAARELDKVKVIQDKTLAHRLSLARNGEVNVSVDISNDIHPDATVEGGLMLELGSLLDVQESRDEIHLSSELKSASNFQQAVMHAIKQIIQHPNLADTAKLKYINTIVVGLYGLTKGNAIYEKIVNDICVEIKAPLEAVIKRLKQNNYVLLPQQGGFAKLIIPQGKQPLFLQENIFSWDGVASLKEIYGEVIIPGIRLGPMRLPLVVLPFKPQALERVNKFYRFWHQLNSRERLPMIKTQRFVAVPEELGGQLQALIRKHAQQGLTEKEEGKLEQLLMMINIATADETVTDYEIIRPKEHLRFELPKFKPAGEGIDKQAIDGFLDKPPMQTKQARPAANVPADANQKYVLLENGPVVEVGTGKVVIPGDHDTNKLEPLVNGYYLVSFSEGSAVMRLADYDVDNYDKQPKLFDKQNQTEDLKLIISPDKRFVVQTNKGQVTRFFDCLTQEDITLAPVFSTKPQFSPDGKNFALLENIGPWGYLHVYRLEDTRRQVSIKFDIPVGEVEYNFNPYAPYLIFVKGRSGEMQLIDLNGREALDRKPVVARARALRTDASCAFTVIINKDNQMELYLNKEDVFLETKFAIKDIYVYHYPDGHTLTICNGKKPGEIHAFASDNRPIKQETSSLLKDSATAAFSEIFTSDGGYELYIDKGRFCKKSFIAELQQPQQDEYYKHPQFDLIIDRDNGVAIEPFTRQKVTFSGEIVQTNTYAREYQYPSFELELICRDDKGDFHIFGEQARANNSFPYLFLAIDNTPLRRSAITFDKKEGYKLYRQVLPRKPVSEVGRAREEIAWGYGTIPEIPRSKYTTVSFDGKYFVFLDPKTAEAVYFDPGDPDNLIFTSSAEPGASEEEQKFFDSALKIMEGVAPKDESNKEMTLAEFAIALADSGDTAGARSIIDRMTDDYWKSRASVALAKALAKAREHEQVIIKIRTIPRLDYQARAFAAAAEVTAGLDYTTHAKRLFTYALEKIDEITDSTIQLDVLLDVIESLGNSGNTDGIEELFTLAFEKSKKTTKPDICRKALAKALAKSGNIPGAREVIIDITDEACAIGAMAAVVEVLAKSGQFEQAEEEFGEIIEVINRSRAPEFTKAACWTAVAEALANSGDADRALRIIVSFEDNSYKAQVLAAVVIALAKSGDFKHAIDIMKQINNSQYLSIAVVEVAKILGVSFGGREFLGEIIKIIEDVGGKVAGEKFRLISLAAVAEALVNLGDGEIIKKIEKVRGERISLTELSIIRLLKAKELFNIDDKAQARELFNEALDIIKHRIPDQGRDSYEIILLRVAELSAKFLSLAGGTKLPGEETIPDKKALELWKAQIIPQREIWITQARSAYQPFLKLIPAEFKADIDELIQRQIEELYQQQQKEVIRRYLAALEGQALAFQGLPFSSFSQRIQQVIALLKDNIATVEAQLIRDRSYPDLRACYRALFSGLFELSKNSALNVEAVDEALFLDLAYGWQINSQAQVDTIGLISELIKGLRADNQSIKYADLRKIVEFLSKVISQNPGQNAPIVNTQLNKILKANAPTKAKYLSQLAEAFNEVKPEALQLYLHNPQETRNLGKARPFCVFLSQEVNLLPIKERFIPQGKDEPLPQGGIDLTRIAQLEKNRLKSGEKDEIMSLEYLLGKLKELPVAMVNLINDFLLNMRAQREGGAHSAEIVQNSKDAGATELIVSFYLQENNGRLEYVEEASDNGSGALQEVALLIDKSTKAQGKQIELSGFFGTGKFTIFEGVDRVELINRNSGRATMFTIEVIKDSNGKSAALKLIGIRHIDGQRVKSGLTVRRIKAEENTIPELDAMLTQRAWQTFTSLAQSDNFKIYFLDANGKKHPLPAEKEVLSEVKFKVKNRRGEATDFGSLRIISTKDMPLQIIDRAGLRVNEIKEEYLDLIPQPLRYFIQELGINIQIPLPLIRNRSAFVDEDYYLLLIQKYVAIEFYKALAYKALTQNNPQFVFEGFSMDWETNDDYWNSIGKPDKGILDLAKKINQEDYSGISEKELEGLLIWNEAERAIKAEAFNKLIVLLEVNNGKGKLESLIGRRIRVQGDKRQAEVLRQAGYEPRISDERDVPYYREKKAQAESIAIGHQQMRNIAKYIVEPETPEERELLALGLDIGRHFKIEQVVLVDSRVSFAGGFLRYQGKLTMALNRSLAGGSASGTIVHELGHLLEQFMRSGKGNGFWSVGFIPHNLQFTHQAIGLFAEAMKYVAAVALANHGKPTVEMVEKEPGIGPGAASRMEAPANQLKEAQRLKVKKEYGAARELLEDVIATCNEIIAGYQNVPALSPDSLDFQILQSAQEKLAIAEGLLEEIQPQAALANKPGGIDFRALPIVTQPMTNLSGTVPLGRQERALAGTVPVFSLDSEWQEIERMLQANITPSTERIKEYLLKSSSDDGFEQAIKAAVSCIADILRIEEESCVSTNLATKNLLALLESGKSAAQIRAALIK